MKAVGARLPRYDGLAHVTGRTLYVDDVRVGRHNGGKALAHLVGETRVRTCLVFSDSRLVGRRASMREMIGATGESPRNDDRSLNASTRQFARVDNRQSIHAGLRREVRCQIRWSSACYTAARHPHYETLSLFAQLRQGRAVHALRA